METFKLRDLPLSSSHSFDRRCHLSRAFGLGHDAPGPHADRLGLVVELLPVTQEEAVQGLAKVVDVPAALPAKRKTKGRQSK